MEPAFTPLRILALIVLAVGFWALGGFEQPDARVVQRAWTYTIVMFLGGAVLATVVDHWVGNLDRSNLRWLYICFGVLLMGGGLMYQHVLREKQKIEHGDLP